MLSTRVSEGVEEVNKDKSTTECSPGCSCGMGLQDILRAAQKESLLTKVNCVDCGKPFWSDRETKYCFDCETKNNK